MQKIEILVVVITQHTLLVNLSSWPFVTAEEAEVARVWSAFEPRPRPVPARPLPRPCFFLFVLSEDGLESMTSRIFAASFADPWCSNYKRMHREKKSESWLYESAKECRRESYYRLTLFSSHQMSPPQNFQEQGCGHHLEISDASGYSFVSRIPHHSD